MTPHGDSIAAKVVRHGGTYAAARLAQRVLALAMVPVYAHYLAPAGYGIVALLASIEPLVLTVFSQGLPASWVRLRFLCEDAAERRRLESTIFWYLVVTSVLLLCAAIAFGDTLVAWIAPGVPFRPLLLLALVNATVRLFSELYLRRLQADGEPKAFARFTTLRAVATMGMVAFFIVALEGGPEGKLIAELGVVTLFTTIAVFLIRPSLVFDWTLLRASLAYGLPLLPHVLMGTLQGAVSRVLVTHTLGIAATGVFSMGFAIANLGSLLAMALNQAFLPLFYEAVKDSGEGPAATREVGRAGCLIVCSVGVLGLALSAGARELLLVMATPEFDQAWQVVAPLCASIVLQAVYFVFAQSVLYDTSGSQKIVWASGLAVAVNALVCAALLPRLGIVAAGLALVLANAALASVAFLLGRRRVRVAYSVPRWSAALAVSFLGMAALFLADLQLVELVPRVLTKLAILSAGTAALVRIAELSPAMFSKPGTAAPRPLEGAR